MHFTTDPAVLNTARTITRIMSNDEDHESDAVNACITAILEGSGTGDQVELYGEAFREQGDEYALYCHTAGTYVRDVILDEIEFLSQTHGLTDFIDTLLRGLLDLGNAALWAEVADTFMPDPERVAEVAADR